MFDEVVTMGKKQARIIILILVLCFVGAFLLSYGYIKYASQKGAAISLSPTPQAVAPITSSVSLALVADKNIIEKGTTFSAEIQIDSGNTQIEAADFVVSFDPAFLQPRKIQEGKFFGALPVMTLEKDFVKISGMASLVGDTIVVPKGKGTVATIVFETNQATESTAIKIDREKTIIASKGVNILDTKKITDLTVGIK
jgi:hypothetical protein